MGKSKGVGLEILGLFQQGDLNDFEYGDPPSRLGFRLMLVAITIAYFGRVLTSGTCFGKAFTLSSLCLSVNLLCI